MEELFIDLDKQQWKNIGGADALEITYNFLYILIAANISSPYV
jgi:hypothetical protein